MSAGSDRSFGGARQRKQESSRRWTSEESFQDEDGGSDVSNNDADDVEEDVEGEEQDEEEEGEEEEDDDEDDDHHRARGGHKSQSRSQSKSKSRRDDEDPDDEKDEEDEGDEEEEKEEEEEDDDDDNNEDENDEYSGGKKHRRSQQQQQQGRKEKRSKQQPEASTADAIAESFSHALGEIKLMVANGQEYVSRVLEHDDVKTWIERASNWQPAQHQRLPMMAIIGTVVVLSLWQFWSKIYGFKLPQSRLADKRNFLNMFFVKYGWAWTVIPLAAYVTKVGIVAASDQRRHITSAWIRIGIATLAWIIFTQSSWSLFHLVLVVTGGCTNASRPVQADGSAHSFTSCKANGGQWIGFDVSGHCFMLILAIGLIWEELQMGNVLAKALPGAKKSSDSTALGSSSSSPSAANKNGMSLFSSTSASPFVERKGHLGLPRVCSSGESIESLSGSKTTEFHPPAGSGDLDDTSQATITDEFKPKSLLLRDTSISSLMDHLGTANNNDGNNNKNNGTNKSGGITDDVDDSSSKYPTPPLSAISSSPKIHQTGLDAATTAISLLSSSSAADMDYWLPALGVTLYLLLTIWGIMLASTSLYFHNLPEKVIGSACGLGVWVLTYGIVYPHTSVPGMPTDLVAG